MYGQRFLFCYWSTSWLNIYFFLIIVSTCECLLSTVTWFCDWPVRTGHMFNCLLSKFILKHFDSELKNIFSIWEMCTLSVLCQWILIILMMRISATNNSVFPAHVLLRVNSDNRTLCEVRLSATRGLFIAELDKTRPSCCCLLPVTVKPHSVLTRDNTQGCTCCSHQWHTFKELSDRSTLCRTKHTGK